MTHSANPDEIAAATAYEELYVPALFREWAPRLCEAVELLQRLAGDDAADALRAPFVLGDRDELRSMFEEVGAGPVRIVTQTGPARFPSVRTMVEADLRGWLPVMGVALSEEMIEQILTEAEQVLPSYVTEQGTMEFEAPAHDEGLHHSWWISL